MNLNEEFYKLMSYQENFNILYFPDLDQILNIIFPILVYIHRQIYKVGYNQLKIFNLLEIKYFNDFYSENIKYKKFKSKNDLKEYFIIFLQSYNFRIQSMILYLIKSGITYVNYDNSEIKEAIKIYLKNLFIQKGYKYFD